MGGTNKRLDWLVLGILVITWGSAFAGLKIAVEGIHPFWVSAIRLWVAAMTLWLLGAARGDRVAAGFDPVFRSHADGVVWRLPAGAAWSRLERRARAGFPLDAGERAARDEGRGVGRLSLRPAS